MAGMARAMGATKMGTQNCLAKIKICDLQFLQPLFYVRQNESLKNFQKITRYATNFGGACRPAPSGNSHARVVIVNNLLMCPWVSEGLPLLTARTSWEFFKPSFWRTFWDDATLSDAITQRFLVLKTLVNRYTT